MKSLSFLLGASIAACFAPSCVYAVDIEDIPIQVPIKDAQGHAWNMLGHVCRATALTPAHLVVINHGSPPGGKSEREKMQPESCTSAPAVWFMQRGFAVVFVLRLGYGNVDSPWTESYHCTAAGFYQAGLETARQIQAIVDTASHLPNIAPDGIVVVGHSAGGWGTIAYDSLPHAHVAAVINMAGGRGGHYQNEPNSNCHAEHLIEAAGQFGKTATTPMLWVYAHNDSFFGPFLAQSLNQAFTAAGGRTRFVQTAAFGDDGHALFHGGAAGRAVWGPLFESYLEEQHALPDISDAAPRHSGASSP